MVMAESNAEGDALVEAAELFAHGLAHRLQRLEPRAAFGHMSALSIGRATVG